VKCALTYFPRCNSFKKIAGIDWNSSFKTAALVELISASCIPNRLKSKLIKESRVLRNTTKRQSNGETERKSAFVGGSPPELGFVSEGERRELVQRHVCSDETLDSTLGGLFQVTAVAIKFSRSGMKRYVVGRFRAVGAEIGNFERPEIIGGDGRAAQLYRFA